uniref:Uncharacterized protein n=1 Tax=Caloglossa beccarii TaxID=131038 RepID=A0A1Z1M8I4_9FLOR|nr:hypothetical protein [Caloglossa beccarii]ARW62387.1 hypothetical protein [Caloglossa beccarii]
MIISLFTLSIFISYITLYFLIIYCIVYKIFFERLDNSF